MRRKRAPKKIPPVKRIGPRLMKMAYEDYYIAEGLITISGRGHTIKGASRPFIYTPKPFVVCPKRRAEQSEGCLTWVCSLTNEPCAYGKGRPEGCVGKIWNPPSYFFRIMCDVKFNGDTYDFAFVNHRISPRLKLTPTTKSGWLLNVYDKINKRMDVRLRRLVGTPKPGEALFHTILAAQPRAIIYLLTGQRIEGKIEGYHAPAGGLIQLIVSTREGKDIIELSHIGLLLIRKGDYKFEGEGAKVRELGLKLLCRGHVVRILPKVPAKRVEKDVKYGIVYDLCRFPRIIELKPGIHPKKLKLEDPHDREVLDVWKEIQ